MIIKLRSAPVFYTVSEIKFNPVVQMEKYVPILQEQLRNQYPGYREEILNQVSVQFNEGKREVQTQPHKRWSFTDAEDTEGYLLFQDSLVFHTTLYSRYNNFDEFLQKLLYGLKQLHSLVEIAYVERLGLRYVNAFTAMPGDILEKYLNASLTGFSIVTRGALAHTATEIMTQCDDNSKLVIRSIVTEKQPSLPPDLLPLRLNMQPRFSALSGRSVVLDFDCFSLQRVNFNIEYVKAELIKYHDAIIHIFLTTTTDYARNIWEQ